MPLHDRLLPLVAAAVLLTVSVPNVFAAEVAVWHIKAVHPEGRLLDIKALDQSGRSITSRRFRAIGIYWTSRQW